MIRGDAIRTGVGALEASAPTCEMASTEEEIARLEPVWNSLRSQVANPSPYTIWSYAETWRAHYGKGAKAVFLTVCDGDRVEGIVPMFVERISPFSLGIRRLRQIGFSGKLGPEDLTEEPILLARPGSERMVLIAVIKASRSLPGWDALILRGQGENYGPAFKQASASVGIQAFPARVKPGSMVVYLPATWEGYRQRLTKSMRDNLAYYPRLLTRHGKAWSVRTVAVGPELADAVEHLARLHDCRVKGAAKHDGHLRTKQQIEFLKDIHLALGREKEAFVALLEVDGEVVAAQSFYESCGTLLVSYSGFDPTFAPYSPLFVIQGHVFKEALERGVRRLDFLQGDQMWQSRWGGQHDGDLAHLVVLRTNPWSLLRSSIYAIRHEATLFFRRLSSKRRARAASAK